MSVQRIHIIIGIFALLLSVSISYRVTRNNSSIPVISHAQHNPTPLLFISKHELAVHNGNDPTLPIYIGLDGFVYDVTSGKKFYQSGAVYHYLAGKDSSQTLHIMGSETIKQKYPIIGILSE